MNYLDTGSMISPCTRFRYTLQRVWERGDRLLFVMLNPSTADAFNDDATIRSCVRLAKKSGYGGLEVVNLFAFRATRPAELKRVPKRGDDENNDNWIRTAAQRSRQVAAAWGAFPFASERAERVIKILMDVHLHVYCFGTSKTGAPRHPLYLPASAQMTLYRSNTQ